MHISSPILQTQIEDTTTNYVLRNFQRNTHEHEHTQTETETETQQMSRLHNLMVSHLGFVGNVVFVWSEQGFYTCLLISYTNRDDK